MKNLTALFLANWNMQSTEWLDCPAFLEVNATPSSGQGYAPPCKNSGRGRLADRIKLPLTIFIKSRANINRIRLFNNSKTHSQQYNNIGLICLCCSNHKVTKAYGGGVFVKRIFAILAAVTAGLSMLAAIIATAASHREHH